MAKTTKKSESTLEPKEATLAESNLSDNFSSADQTENLAKETSQAEGKSSKVAKAGKRSAKAIKEAEQKQDKEDRKLEIAADTETAKPKAPIIATRSRLERRSKGYREKAGQIIADKTYKLEEAIELARSTSHVKFDASVELHANLNVDPRQADQNIRDSLLLPAGTGKSVRVAVLTTDAAEAIKAGADIAGTDDLLAQLDKGKLDFDILISTPSLMARLGKYARILGPRGLMPNPKSGSVTNDVNRAIAEAKAGRVEYRVDSSGIIHLAVGKVSFSANDLLKNTQAILASIKSNRPSSIKNTYIKSIHLTTSMGPSVKVDVNSIG